MTVTPEKLARISVDQYHRMIDLRILEESDRLELLDGIMVLKMPNNPLHAGTLQLLYAILSKLTPNDLGHWRTQLPITLATSEPEPDIVFVKGKEKDYLAHHPRAKEVLLIIELADSSLKQDQTTKYEIYAEAGVEVYWIVNLQQKVVEVFSQPSGPQAKPEYCQYETFSQRDIIPIILAGKTLARVAASEFLEQ